MPTLADFINRPTTTVPRPAHGAGTSNTQGQGGGESLPVIRVPLIQVAGLVPMRPCDASECRTYDIGRYCNKHKVFGNVVDGVADPDASYENDRNNFMVDFQISASNPSGLVTFTIQKCVGREWVTVATVTNNDYGTYRALGSIPLHPTYAEFYVNWGKVLLAFGQCGYRILATSSYGELTSCLASEEFSLRQFGCFFADHTIKLETVMTGKRGSATRQGYVYDLCGMVFKDSIRIPGFFGRREVSEYLEVINEYPNGQQNQVRDEAIEAFKMFTKMLPDEIHKRISVYAMMPNRLWVSDYNYSNPDYSINHLQIKKAGAYKPEYFDGVRESSVVVEFKAGVQNIIASLCCNNAKSPLGIG